MRSIISIPCAIALALALGMVAQSARRSRGEKHGPRVTGVGGFFFKAQHRAKFADWYRVHFGIAVEPAAKGENTPQFHPFEWREKNHPDRNGLTLLSIFPVDAEYFAPSSAAFMTNFRVANLDRVLAQLRQVGAKVDDKIDDGSNGRFSWAMDPEGNRIELWEPQGE